MTRYQALSAILYAFVLVLGMQACKVVIEDPQGHRIGELDSTNVDSILRHASSLGYSSFMQYSSIPPYSSIPYSYSSGMSLPYSLSSFSSSSSKTSSSSGTSSSGFSCSGNSSSSVSSSKPGSSSSHSSSSISSSSQSSSSHSSSSHSSSSHSSSSVSSSSGQCKVITIEGYGPGTFYTWIEPYSDGHRDTIVSTDTLGFYQTESYDNTSLSAQFPPNYPMPSIATQQNACPGDSVYDLADAGGVYRHVLPGSDTVFMNYGPSALHSLVTPVVRLTNKASIQSRMASVSPYGTYRVNGLMIQHYVGDGLRIAIIGPAWIYNTVGPPQTLRLNPLPCPGYGDTTAIIPAPTSAPTDYVDMVPNASVSPRTQVAWVIRIRNRFGYSDSLAMNTSLEPFTCP